MKLPKQTKPVDTQADAPVTAVTGVKPAFLGALGSVLGIVPGLVETGVNTAKIIGCPIACARNDRSAIRGLGCNC